MSLVSRIGGCIQGQRVKTPILVMLLMIGLAAVIDQMPGRAGLDRFDQASVATVDATLKRTVEIFAISKVINSVLSVAKSATVSAGLVVNGSISPGQALDPFDRIVDDFTNWMLDAVTIIVTTKLAIIVTQQFGLVGFTALVAGLLCAASYAKPRFDRMARFLEAFGLLLLVARFGFPLCVLVLTVAMQGLLAIPYEQSVAVLKQLGGSPSESTFTAVTSVQAAAKAITADSGTFISALGTVAAVLFFDVIATPLLAIWASWSLLRACVPSR